MGRDLPVILLTGRGSIELDLEAMEMGAFDFLEKADLTPVLLERSIRYAIENHRVRAALRKANEELEERVRQRTAELNRSNQALEQFADLVARDLQQPLQAITRQIRDMKTRKAGREKEQSLYLAYRFLDPVLHAARNMELLVQSVLDYSRVGKVARPFDDVDLGELVREVCDDLDSTISQTGAEVIVEDMPVLKADRMLMKGLFENLLDNAIKFRGDEPPQIRIWSERKEGSWLCAVKDNGIGIPDEDIDDVFLMFNRGSRDTEYPGIGIGLAMCRKIAQYHRGRIWADSKLGEGSTFYLALPAEG